MHLEATCEHMTETDPNMDHLLVKPLAQLSFAMQFVLSRTLSDMWAARISHPRFWADKDYPDGGHPWWIRVSCFFLMLPLQSPLVNTLVKRSSLRPMLICVVYWQGVTPKDSAKSFFFQFCMKPMNYHRTKLFIFFILTLRYMTMFVLSLLDLPLLVSKVSVGSSI